MMNTYNILFQFMDFMKNPGNILARRGLSADAIKNPQAAVQKLLNSGQMSQEQFNQLRRMAQQIQNNPQFTQMFGG